MLYLAESMHKLDFRQLMDVYAEGNLENAREMFPQESEEQGILLAEQDFYQYLRECFFSTPGAFYGVWVVDGRYVSALRLEPYQDGMLLEALETKPECRGNGYAADLVSSVLKQLPGRRIYSHVSKRNKASLRVHEKCGFHRILEHAVYADGSVLSTSCTLCTEKLEAKD